MPRSSSNDFILVVPYYSRHFPTGRHGTARNFVETGLNRNSRFPNWSPVDGSDFVVFLDFPKVGKMTRTAIGLPRESRIVTPRARHTPEKTDRRVELRRFSRFAELIPRRRRGLCRFSRFVSKNWQNDAPGRLFVYMHKWSLPSSSPSFPSLSLRWPGPGPTWPRWAWPDRTAPSHAAWPRRAAPGRAAPGSYRRPAGLRNATGGEASAHTTGPGSGMRPAAGLRNATRLRRTRPGQVSAGRLLNWSPVDGSDFVVVFLDFSNYHPVKVAKCLVTSSS